MNNCNCIQEINADLIGNNTKLLVPFRFVQRGEELGREAEVRTFVATTKIDASARKGPQPPLAAIFCPFCGQKYDDARLDLRGVIRSEACDDDYSAAAVVNM